MARPRKGEPKPPPLIAKCLYMYQDDIDKLDSLKLERKKPCSQIVRELISNAYKE